MQRVHMSHKLTVDSPATDDQFGLTRDAVRISRDVSVFQWVEHHRTEERKLNNGETEVQHRIARLGTVEHNPGNVSPCR